MMYPRLASTDAVDLMPTPLPTLGPERPPRHRASGMGRPGGLLTAAVTAAIVFAVGKQFLPQPVPPPPPPAPAPPPAPREPTPPAPTTDAHAADADAVAAPDGAAAEGDAKAAMREDAAASARDARVALGKPAAEPTPAAPDGEAPSGEAAEAAATSKSADAASQADKDLARESWRRNKPDISASGGKASILIPVKGSTAGGAYKYFKKTRAVVITLPKAASLNTMKFYKLKRDGFATLWIDQEEVNARASDGTKLRLVLTAPAVPIVDIRDDFVRVTIARPRD